MSPIKLPRAYAEALRKFRSEEESIKSEINNGILLANTGIELAHKLFASTSINKKFMVSR